MKEKPSQISLKIKRLAHIAQDLRNGKDYSITRLTTIKSFCEDPKAASHFALHLSKLTRKTLSRQSCPEHIDKEKWRECKRVVNEVIILTEDYLEQQTTAKEAQLRELLLQARGLQNEHKYIRGGSVRIILSRAVLLVEYALECVLSPYSSSIWGYRVAREFAERYDSRYGSGLIPDSAPMVEEMADFWCKYHLGQSLGRWVST